MTRARLGSARLGLAPPGSAWNGLALSGLARLCSGSARARPCPASALILGTRFFFQALIRLAHIYIYPLHILWDEWKLFGGYHQADGIHDGVHRHTGYFAAYNLR